MQINALDYAVTAAYLLGIVGIGVHAGLRQKRGKSEATGYFLAANSLKWPEMVQAIVLLVGAILITWFAWDKAGGWDGMVATLQMSGEMTKLSMLRSDVSESLCLGSVGFCCFSLS
jgi:Na+/proline symporter